jgi:hypothetical protein
VRRNNAAKGELINTERTSDSCGVALLEFKESDDVGRSLSVDRRKKAGTKVKSGQADKGDRCGTRRTPIRRAQAASRQVARSPHPAESGTPTVAGIRISHPDRLIYPDLDISKIQLALY